MDSYRFMISWDSHFSKCVKVKLELGAPSGRVGPEATEAARPTGRKWLSSLIWLRGTPKKSTKKMQISQYTVNMYIGVRAIFKYFHH